ncbi:alpha-1,6-mannosylglycoprotein 6-beta-N-acetylglucosaminyltransferase B-like [Arapaima gigas]
MGIIFFSMVVLMISFSIQYSALHLEESMITPRFHPMKLLEQIQVIALNLSHRAAHTEQHTYSNCFPTDRQTTVSSCEIPVDPLYPECSHKMDWLRNFWTSDPCFVSYGVDGSNCSFLIYLSEVEDFCPPLSWRKRIQSKKDHIAEEKRPATFRVDVSALLAKLGEKKESLKFMKRRIQRLGPQWAAAARHLDRQLGDQGREQKRILVHMGFLAISSGDGFSSMVLKGGPLGEMVQWADILTALYILGHRVQVSVTIRHLQRILGKPYARRSCPASGFLPFDLIYTDYHGLDQIEEYRGISLRTHKCRIRVIDTFGTEPAYNNKEYAFKHGYRSSWGHRKLDSKQYMTMFPHTPDNSFMGFVVDELNETEKLDISRNKINNMTVVYGKEISMWERKEHFFKVLHRHMEIHGTVYSTDHPYVVPAFVHNHGLLSQKDLQQLLKKAKLFIGFGFPYEGPAPLEAVANGCIFLQPKFHPPHSSLNHIFFHGKPTSRELTSQHPYMEKHIGRPHVMTVNFSNLQEFEETIQEIMRTKVEPYLPFEYTCEGMLERVHAYIQHQDFCAPIDPFPLATIPSPFILLSNSERFTWDPDVKAPPSWPPLRSLQALISQPGHSCITACEGIGMVCEPTFFRFINNKQAFDTLKVPCKVLEGEVNHIFPAVKRQLLCSVQKDPRLFSCAGLSAGYQRLCPCRDARHGQVALCQDCL